MIKHIVFFRIKSDSKEDDLAALKSMIEDLGTKIPEIQKIEAGINFSTRDTAYDLALVSEFKSEEDLKVYSAHPDHQKLIQRLHELDRDIAVVDYYF